MEIEKTGVFSVLGRPNVGKSTLMNALCGEKVAIVSNKPQTTRTRVTGVLNDDGCQMVFIDTPGLHRPKTKLGEYMVRRVYEAVGDVDTAILVVEPQAKIGEAERLIIEKLKEYDMPAILLINKIDTLKKDRLSELLPVIDLYSKAFDFKAVIPVSAKTKEGLSELLPLLKGLCFESHALFPEGMTTDQTEMQLICEIIREKLLICLNEELPHGCAVEIERLNERDDRLIEISALIYCERKSHKGMIIGKRGGMLKKIGELARIELEEVFSGKVFLELWVKVKEDWRQNPNQVGNMGYRE